MSVSIKVNGTANSLVHKGSNHIATCTVPDVCKTPSPGGPVPIPYPVIVSMSSDLANGSTTVKADGGNMIGIKDCEFSRCTGDEAGTAGGVKSSTFGKEAKFILYSFDVKIDGGNACRLGDKLTMNHENTVCLGGANGPPVTIGQIKDALCQDLCKHENGVQNGTRKRRKSDDLERECQASGKYGNRTLFRQRYKSPPNTSTKWTKPDAITSNKSQCFDFKLCGDSSRGDQVIRQQRITTTKAKPIIISCANCKKCKPKCKCPPKS